MSSVFGVSGPAMRRLLALPLPFLPLAGLTARAPLKAPADANRATSRFIIDSLWDRPTHPEGWYFRSDHVPYAERGVPALFFASNLHRDYHTPRDEPKTIDYPKLTPTAKWLYMTGWIAGNATTRPAVDSGFVLRWPARGTDWGWRAAVPPRHFAER